MRASPACLGASSYSQASRAAFSRSLLLGNSRRKWNPDLAVKSPDTKFFAPDPSADQSIVLNNYLALADYSNAWLTYRSKCHNQAPVSSLKNCNFLDLTKLLNSQHAASSILNLSNVSSSELLSSLSFHSVSPSIVSGLRAVLRDVSKTGSQTPQITAEAVRILALTDNVAVAVRLVRSLYSNSSEAESIHSNSVAIESLTEVLANSGRIDVAISFYETLKSSNITPSIETTAALIRAYGRHGQVEKAQKLFTDTNAKYSKTPVLLLDALSEVYGENGEIGFAQNLMMSSRNMHTRASVGVYTGLIGANAKRANVGGAIEAYRRMRLDGQPASHRTLEHLIRVHTLSNDTKSAIKYFYKKENVPEFTPDAGMCAALVEAHVASGNILQAWRVVKEMIKIRTPPIASSSAIRDADGTFANEWAWIPPNVVASLAKEHAGQDQRYLYDILRFAGFDGAQNQYETSAAVVAVIQSLVQQSAHTNDQTLATHALTFFSAFEQLPDEYVPIAAFVAAISANAKLSAPENAQRLFTRLVNHIQINAANWSFKQDSIALHESMKIPRVAYDDLVRSYAQAGKLTQAFELVFNVVNQYAEQPVLAFAKPFVPGATSESLSVPSDSLPHPDVTTFDALLEGVYRYKEKNDEENTNPLINMIGTQRDDVVQAVVDDMIKLGAVPQATIHRYAGRAIEQRGKVGLASWMQWGKQVEQRQQSK
ncbi:hypothetical protein HK096_007964 [Nowakowskiella sp. JEL0078]|nr:hypothetical protein HK096_007964 [Nowakowskiella sp. JEL0078]